MTEIAFLLSIFNEAIITKMVYYILKDLKIIEYFNKNIQ